MSSQSKQDEQLTESESDEELQSLGSQSEGEGQDEDDSDSDLGDLEEGVDDSEDDEENAGLVIDEDQSTDDDEEASDDDDEDEPSEGDDEEVASEEDNEEMEQSEHNSDEDHDGAKKVPNDLRLKILNKIKSRYENRLGKTLYVRFPHRLPVDTAEVLNTLKEFSSRISKVRRMRQKYARYCLVDFESHEDREKGLEELKAAKIDGKDLVVSYPRSEAPDFFEQATEKRLNKITQNTIKTNLKKLVKDKGKLKTKVFTSTIIVRNIPASASLSEIKELFPQAVDTKVNFAKGKNKTSTATVTMPTPQAATQVKKSKVKMNDKILQISFSKTNLQNPAASKEGNDSVASESPKKGKRKLEEATSEFSTPPKKNKKNKNKSADPNQKVKNVKGKEPKKNTSAPLEKDSESPKNVKGKKPWKEMNTDGTKNNPKPQNQNPNSKQTNFSDKQQKKQKNPNAIKNGSNETVEQLVGSDDVPKKQIFSKEQKDKQIQKPKFPVMEKEDRQNKKPMFPIMKKNLQGKGVKSGKVFKNKPF